MAGGRPPIFETPEQLQNKIDEYFEYVKGETVLQKSSSSTIPDHVIVKREPEPITITGLALFLGFSSRQGIYDLEEKPEFSCIRKARLRVENAYEQNLHRNNPTGSIFALKNMGWSDKHEVAQTITDKRKDLSKLSDDDLTTLESIYNKIGEGEEDV